MKFLSNIYDPRLPDAKAHVHVVKGQTLLQAWNDHVWWINGKFIGEPQATEKYTAEELRRFGMVGLYSKD